MGMPCVNFASIEEFNYLLGGGDSDSTYLGHFEIHVSVDEDAVFFGANIKDALKAFKAIFKKKK